MKSLFVIIAVTAFGFSSLLADTAIFVALPSELDTIRTEIRVVGKPVELAGHRITIGYRKGEKLYLAKTGAGNLNSAMVTQALLTRYRIDRVISIGIAGNLTDHWSVGDVMCVTNVISHQVGKETPAGFDVKQEPEARGQKLEEYWSKCGELRSNAMEIAQSLLRSGGGTTNGTTEIPRQARNDKKEEKLRDFATLREGRLVSGDSFIASSEKHKWLRETFHADAVDMVSLGIARVCEANGVPYVIIRTLSDNANESASADFATFVQKYNEPVTATIAVGIIDRVAAATPRSPSK